MAEKLDAVDRKILNILQENATTPLSRIGKALGISEATVRYRVKNLEKKEVIKTYTTLLNPAKVGLSTTGVMMVRVDPALFEQAAKEIGDLPETYHVFPEYRRIRHYLSSTHAGLGTSGRLKEKGASHHGGQRRHRFSGNSYHKN